MNSSGTGVRGVGAVSGMTTISTSPMSSCMLSDDISESSSQESAHFDESDLLRSPMNDDVTAQLAAAGPVGVAAAAAIATSRKRRRMHSFETNPSIRRRQQTRLLRKLRAIIEEYSTRVGQQAVVLCCTPGKPNQHYQSFKVFGSQPLETVVRNSKGIIMQDLESALAQQAPPSQMEDPNLHKLPRLVIDGIPTPVDKMTQAQLRAFIPEMLKYSTGRSKPGWGKAEYRPVWWPDDVPWANVRSDARSEEEKRKVSWTHALRQIVKNCYKHHGREDMLPEFTEENHASPHHQYAGTMVQTINNPDGTVSIIQIDTGASGNTSVVTLADGTQATVVHAVPENHQHEATQAVQTLADAATHMETTGNGQPVRVEMNTDSDAHTVATLAEATVNQDGQIILTGDPTTLGGLVSFPVSMFHNITTFKTTDLNNQGNYRVASVNQHHHNGELTSLQTLNDNHLSSIGHADSSGVTTMEVMAVDQS